jgi:putative aminopeptidase FrvX
MIAMNPLELLQELVSLPGPPGQERLVREAVAKHVKKLGLKSRTDAKGNLLVGSENPRILVTAHMDEIAMIVRFVEGDGSLVVGPMGGIFPWKIGEGPVSILCAEAMNGVLSFGSIHTADDDAKPSDWDETRVLTGRCAEELEDRGVRSGTRVVVHPSRRNLLPVGEWVGGHFLDDRADLVSWLLALEALGEVEGVLFAATASEEVGGEGALYIMQALRPEICIALELGPNPLDAPVEITEQPTVWTTDSYSTMSAADGDLIAALGVELEMELQFQALTSGGSDASCAASHGLCARPFTLGLPMENSHGFEVMHPGAMSELARLTVALVKKLS